MARYELDGAYASEQMRPIRLHEKDAHLVNMAMPHVQHDLESARTLLDPTHPVIRKLENEASQIDRSIAVTAHLFDETIRRWGEIIGVKPEERDEALQNLLTFDFQRVKHLTTYSTLVGILKSGMHTEGKVRVSYELTDEPGTLRNFDFSKEFVTYDLEGAEKIYKCRKDPAVPFFYLFAGDMSMYEEHLPDAYKLFRDLYAGEPIPVNGDEGGPPIVLSSETRGELENIGCLVLHPTANNFCTDEIEKATEKGVIKVPVKKLPWITESGITSHFGGFIAGQLEHETTHVKDYRTYNAAQISDGLLEVRAFCRQLDFHTRQQQDRYVCWSLDSLAPYLDIFTGQVQEIGSTHVENTYLGEIQSALSEIPKRKAQAVRASLASFGYSS